MIFNQAEALILRTWPLHEADQIVSLFTRDQGKLKGIAKSSARSRKRFGGALEPMTYVLASYVEKPRQELVRLDSCEILISPLSASIDYARASALAFFAEVLEESLPDHDPQDPVFRLTLAVLDHTRAGQIWLPVTYFSLWITRLMGWMPEIARCTHCSKSFAGEAAYFNLQSDGLFCAEHKHPSSRILSSGSLATASRILQAPIGTLAAEDWPRTRAADLRRFAMQALERHLERKLHSVAALVKLEG
ncbi:MAG TPA: DNA repair protein RecO [Silvibacterium sp.]|nr:DNA repair protein RecO [Silvibacterium sp.]